MMYDNEYYDFLKEKIDIAPENGFEIPPDTVNRALKPHQRDAVMWAVRGKDGRADEK